VAATQDNPCDSTLDPSATPTIRDRLVRTCLVETCHASLGTTSLGRPARSFEQFAADHAAAFS
jgi:hypothetical protein